MFIVPPVHFSFAFISQFPLYFPISKDNVENKLTLKGKGGA